MSTLFERLQQDLGAAMKAGTEVEKSTLLLIVATIKNVRSAGGDAGTLTDAQVIRVLRAETKKRSEAADMYKGAGRSAAEAKERTELAILMRYLPARTDDTDLGAIIATEVASAAAAGITGSKAVGQVIKAVRAKAGTDADGAEIAGLVKAALGMTPSVTADEPSRTSESQEVSESVRGHLSDYDLPVPSRSVWYRFNHSQESCLEAVGRAQSLLASDNARDDINGRLGTNAEEVLAVACNSIGCDPDAHGSSTGFPVIQVHPSVLDYLGLNPDDFGGIEFAMTLGSYLDSKLGIVPVIFAGTRYQRRTRVVALIWSLVKAGDPELIRQREDFAAMARSLINGGGDQGGLVAMSRLAIMVLRPQGGVDAMTGPFFVPLKLWRYLSMSVFLNASGASAGKFSPPWPYPLQLSGSSQSDNLFASPGASRFLQWY